MNDVFSGIAKTIGSAMDNADAIFWSFVRFLLFLIAVSVVIGFAIAMFVSSVVVVSGGTK